MCELILELRVALKGWPHEGHPPTLSGDEVWMTASDLLPRLGLDPDRALRNPDVRARYGLPPSLPSLPRLSLVPAVGAAPAGSWRWQVNLPKGWSLAHRGETRGPLDFAVVWRAHTPEQATRDMKVAWHGRSRGQAAAEVLADLQQMETCLDGLGPESMTAVETVLQAPRGSRLAVHGPVFWLPEDQGWDVGETGFGRWQRRRLIARGLAEDRLERAANLRSEPGARWLREGVAGWLALRCLRQLDGDEAWLALFEHDAASVVQALFALEAPIRSVADDGPAEWVKPYTGLATFGWASTIGEAKAAVIVDEVIASVRRGTSIAQALKDSVGSAASELLLGPPLASDVKLQPIASGRFRAKPGLRWRWEGGTWVSVTPAQQVVLLSAGGERGGYTTQVLDVTESREVRGASLTALDTWPSFERSIEDNVGRLGEAHVR